MVNKTSPVSIGISACLLGQKVRYDGGHKRDEFLVHTVSRFVKFVPVCPEVDIGLGIPRESIHLTLTPKGVHLTAPKSGRDLTEQMRKYTDKKTAEIGQWNLSGYILKKDSPSCGMERVRVHIDGRPPLRNGHGLFAQGLMERFPCLPVEEEGRLQDPQLRENFFERVFAYRRLMDFFAAPWRLADLVKFHTGEKILLLSHTPQAYSRLGRLVAESKGRTTSEVAGLYQKLFMDALRNIATVPRHVNALQHMAGHLKNLISADEKNEWGGVIEDFQRKLVPLIVPLTLLRHHVRRHHVVYLEGQSYLDPHPKELMLRNHV